MRFRGRSVKIFPVDRFSEGPDSRGNRTTPNKKRLNFFSLYFAEEEGFEPPVPLGTTVFKTAAIDHSATPLCRTFQIECAKVYPFPISGKTFLPFSLKSLIFFRLIFYTHFLLLTFYHTHKKTNPSNYTRSVGTSCRLLLSDFFFGYPSLDLLFQNIQRQSPTTQNPVMESADVKLVSQFGFCQFSELLNF